MTRPRRGGFSVCHLVPVTPYPAEPVKLTVVVLCAVLFVGRMVYESRRTSSEEERYQETTTFERVIGLTRLRFARCGSEGTS